MMLFKYQTHGEMAERRDCKCSVRRSAVSIAFYLMETAAATA